MSTGRVCWYDSQKRFISGSQFFPSGNTTNIWPAIFTTPENAYYMLYSPTSEYGNTYNNDISINYPPTDTDYHAYQGTTASVTFPDSAGTVYGGTVDLVSGKLVVDWAIVDLGTRTWTYIAPTTSIPYGTFYTTIYSKKFGQFNIICDSYPIKAGFNNDFAIQGNSGTGTVYLQNSNFNGDTVALKTSLNGVMLCYELAEPITYQLTPQEINTLIGVNNIWADTGDVSVKYRTH